MTGGPSVGLTSVGEVNPPAVVVSGAGDIVLNSSVTDTPVVVSSDVTSETFVDIGFSDVNPSTEGVVVSGISPGVTGVPVVSLVTDGSLLVSSFVTSPGSEAVIISGFSEGIVTVLPASVVTSSVGDVAEVNSVAISVVTGAVSAALVDGVPVYWVADVAASVVTSFIIPEGVVISVDASLIVARSGAVSVVTEEVVVWPGSGVTPEVATEVSPVVTWDAGDVCVNTSVVLGVVISVTCGFVV